MAMKHYRFADISFTLDARYPWLEEQCREYETEPGAKSIRIAVTEEEIDRENVFKEAYSRGYLESLAVYRKISEAVLDHDAFLFHCSAVAVDGEAYLFSAPSGTGKSTHTRLWRERFGERAVMINDDKPLIRMEEGTFYVYGTPWNGKHHLSVNQKAPVKAICLLERGKTNHAQQISPAEAYPGLYRQIYRPQNDRGKMLKTLQLLHKMAESVPLYRLQCDISQDAVRASWDAFHSQTDRRQDE